MTAVQAAPHEARPGRAALVALDLAELRGPVTGTVELPIWLFWSGPDDSREFDLGEPGILAWVYEMVLREATRSEDLALYLNGAMLAGIWPDLWLPAGVRQAWEEHHPALAAA